MTLSVRLRQNKDFYEKRVESTLKQLESLPEGRLHIESDSKYRSYRYREYRHHKSDERRHYRRIAKRDVKRAALLALRMKLEKQLEDDRRELKAINSYFRYHVEGSHGSVSVKHQEEFDRLLAIAEGPRTRHWDEVCEAWAAQPYTKSTKNPSGCNIQTKKGDWVRSKAEADIANALWDSHIPYRYEEVTNINGRAIAIDFTIMHPVTHKIFAWEHMGALDQEWYRESNRGRFDLLTEGGWIPRINLIITTELPEAPFAEVDALEIIDEYFA